MNERQMRKMISYKIENLNPKERALVDEWANAQSNLHQSLTNIITHIVGFVGQVDVMDFDIQKQLHLTLGDSKTNHAAEQTLNVKMEIPRKKEKDEFPNVDIFMDE